jgi:hypothetical protein
MTACIYSSPAPFSNTREKGKKVISGTGWINYSSPAPFSNNNREGENNYRRDAEINSA